MSRAGRRELAAAGIGDPRLVSAYLACRELNVRHGRTYFLATRLLPAAQRPAVHALYGFARHADEVVDDLGTASTAHRERRLATLAADLFDVTPTLPVAVAVRDTIERFAIPQQPFRDFLTAMRMDLRVTDYATWDDLLRYMHGSAAAIGLMLLPVLGTAPGLSDAAAPYACDLGNAFQLTNFIRDVGEDLRRGRVYLPAEDLAHFGVTRELLAAGVVDGRVRRLLVHEIARARELYRSAEPGIRLLDAPSRDCVRAASTLYAGILDAVEAADYQVLDRRVAVAGVRRGAVAGVGLARALRARHPHG